jgi:glycosyltransferase involved in cell wall biosynthesis
MTAPMRILMLIPQLGFGGAESAFLRLAHNLASEADVTLAVMDQPYSETFVPGAAWTDLPALRLDDSLPAGGAWNGKAKRWWQMLRRLRSLKRQHDVTISFMSGMNLLNALAGPRARTIVSERGSKRHDIGMARHQRLIWTRLLDPLIYWRAIRVVAASEGLAHEIVTANPWAASRVLAIEGTVEATALVDAADLPVEPELQPLKGCETVVTFGRLDVQKGYDVLLSAFSRVRAQRPKARLLLIGAGPEEGRLRILAGNLGLRVDTAGAEADVILPGLRPNPLRYLQVGRVFVLPSRFEGLPNALIEALASGADILASDCPWGPRSILSEGGLSYEGPAPDLPLALTHGVLMPLLDAPGAVQVWAEEIARALGTPARPRLSRADRLAAVAPYDIARTGPRWLDLARSMTHEADPR